MKKKINWALFISMLLIFLSGVIISNSLFYFGKPPEQKNITSFEFPALYKISAPQKHQGISLEQIDNYTICLQSSKPLLTTKIAGTSMRPTADENTIAIYTKPESITELHEGSIISYRNGNYSEILHRIININDPPSSFYFRTKGDNNAEPDNNRVYFSNITGDIIALIY